MFVNVVKKEGDKYYVFSEEGKKLSKGYDTKEDAEKRLGEIEYFKKQNNRCVHVTSTLHCNEGSIAKKTFEGKEHIVIKDAKHMIGDTVMNRVLYPSQEMEVLCTDLNNIDAYVPAPAEHPMVNGNFISAADPRSMIQHNIGSFFFNFSIQNGRMVSDMAIDPKVAELSDRGKEILRRIDDQEDIDMSTGFFLHAINEEGSAEDGDEYDIIAKDLILDHSALLVESPGAKTTGEGVGLFANKDNSEMLVISSKLDDAKPMGYKNEGLLSWFSKKFNQSMNDLREDVQDLLTKKYASEKGDRCLWVVDILDNGYAIFEIDGIAYKHAYLTDENGAVSLEGERTEVRIKTEYIETEGTDDMKDKIVAALNAAGIETEGLNEDQMFLKYNELLKTNMEGGNKTYNMDDDMKKMLRSMIGEMMNEAMGDMKKDMEGMKANMNSQSEAERSSLVATVVANSALDEEDAKALSTQALRKMAANHQTADQLGGDFQVNQSKGFYADAEPAE